jgi:energy-coupling factor transporter ATP-binding protein EcfA2
MYTLGHTFIPAPIHAGGLRYHGDAPLLCKLTKEGVQHHLPVLKAIETYTILTIGDALVAQIPALIISVTAGIIVSRAASEYSMGKELGEQFIGLLRSHGFLQCLEQKVSLCVEGSPVAPRQKQHELGLLAAHEQFKPLIALWRPSLLKGVVEFQDVCFRYPDAEDCVIENITFTARPGQTTAFIGGTGSGKSLCYQIPALIFSGLISGAVAGLCLMLLTVSQIRASEQPWYIEPTADGRIHISNLVRFDNFVLNTFFDTESGSLAAALKTVHPLGYRLLGFVGILMAVALLALLVPVMDHVRVQGQPDDVSRATQAAAVFLARVADCCPELERPYLLDDPPPKRRTEEPGAATRCRTIVGSLLAGPAAQPARRGLPTGKAGRRRSGCRHHRPGRRL